MTNDPEHSRIERILAGEQHLYAEMVDKYKSYAYTIAQKILQNRPDAEEATQDAFIKAYHHLKGFNQQSKFSTWLYRIVFNTAISYKRKNKQQFQSLENTFVEYRGEGEGMLEKTDRKKFLNLAMAKLNEADRTALTFVLFGRIFSGRNCRDHGNAGKYSKGSYSPGAAAPGR